MEDKSPRDLFHSLCLCQKSTHPKSAARNFSLSPLHQEADYGCSRRLWLLVSLETSVGGANPWNPRLKEHASFFLFERHSRNSEALLKEEATEPHAPACLLYPWSSVDSKLLNTGLKPLNKWTLTCSVAQFKSQRKKQKYAQGEGPVGLHLPAKRGTRCLAGSPAAAHGCSDAGSDQIVLPLLSTLHIGTTEFLSQLPVLTKRGFFSSSSFLLKSQGLLISDQA